MLSNNSLYKKAIKEKFRHERVNGTIKLYGTDKIININDTNIIAGSLEIEEKFCETGFSIGNFFSSALQIGIIDENSFEHDFTGAVIELTYDIKTDDNAWHRIPLGKFYAVTIRRKQNTVYISGEDSGRNFDTGIITAEEGKKYTPYELIRAICNACHVPLSTSSLKFNSFPNSSLLISADNAELQTNRDCIKYISALLGCNAIITRSSYLDIRPIMYESIDTDISEDWELTAGERNDTDFTDNRFYIKYLNAYAGDKVKTYKSNLVSNDAQSAEGQSALRHNPLVDIMPEEKQDEINLAVLNYIGRLQQRGIDTVTFGNPALECGDTILLSSGVLDINRRIIGVITKRIWRYREFERIICHAPEPVVSEANETLLPGNEYIIPKSQIEKEIDVIRNKIGRTEKQFDNYKRILIDHFPTADDLSEDDLNSIVLEYNSRIPLDVNPGKNGNVIGFNGGLYPIINAYWFAKGNGDGLIYRVKKNTSIDYAEIHLGYGEVTGYSAPIFNSNFDYDFSIDWGDGSTENYINRISPYAPKTVISHNYAAANQTNEIYITIKGTCPQHALYITDYSEFEVVEWGKLKILSLYDMLGYAPGADNCVFILPDRPITGIENCVDFSHFLYDPSDITGNVYRKIYFKNRNGDLSKTLPGDIFINSTLAADKYFTKTFYFKDLRNIGNDFMKDFPGKIITRHNENYSIFQTCEIDYIGDNFMSGCEIFSENYIGIIGSFYTSNGPVFIGDNCFKDTAMTISDIRNHYYIYDFIANNLRATPRGGYSIGDNFMDNFTFMGNDGSYLVIGLSSSSNEFIKIGINFLNNAKIGFIDGYLYNQSNLTFIGDNYTGNANIQSFTNNTLAERFRNNPLLEQIPTNFIPKKWETCGSCKNLFYGNTKMKGKGMPVINEILSKFGNIPHNGAFYNCTSLDDYDEIPNDWKGY